MKKFENVVKVKYNDLNKFESFVFDNLEVRMGGDWNDYKEGDIVSYDFDLLEKLGDWIDSFIDDWNYDLEDKDKVLLEDLKEYIGEGICLVDEYDEKLWYNVNFEDNVMMVKFEYIDYEC